MHFYGNITKVDAEQRMVWGYASTEKTDNDGEVIAKGAVEDALTDYMQFANIREMHQLSAVGTTKEASVDDKGLYIGAHVVDDAAWAKVQSGVYKGFSVGGKALKRNATNRKIVEKMSMTEISLVDRPCNPECKFDVWKAAGALEAASTTQEDEPMTTNAPSAEAAAPAVDAPKTDDVTKTVDAAAVAAAPAADATPAAAAVATDAPVTAADKVEPAVADAEITKTATTDVQAASADPVAKAEASLAALEGVVAKAAKAGDITKGMYTVSRLSDVLQSLAYMLGDVKSEAEMEGDNSPVPAMLRENVKALAVTLKAMATEEIDELVANASKTAKAVAAADIAKAAAGAAVTGAPVADEVLVKAAAAELVKAEVAKLEAERDDLAKAVAARDDVLEKIATRNDNIAKTVAGLVARIEELETAPLPAKTAGSELAKVTAIGKGQDSLGHGTQANSADADKLAKAVSVMTPEVRAQYEMVIALQNGVSVPGMG